MSAAEPQFLDAVVITDDKTHPDLESHPPAGDDPIELLPGVTIERLPGELAERFITACEPPGEEFNPAAQFSQLYSFVRRGPVDRGAYFAFDLDGVLQEALQFSRLIVPNSHSTEYAVHMLDHATFPFKQGATIVPLRPHARFYAFHAGIGLRDWLTAEDGHALAQLLQRFHEVRDDLPERVTGGLWWAEWAARIPFLEPAHTVAVSGLEALLSNANEPMGAQFVVRALALAEELGVPDITAAMLDDFYKRRSKVTHGQFVSMAAGGGEAEDVHRVQSILRAALRRAVEDDQFASYFKETATIRARWPVPTWRTSVGLSA